VSERKEKGGDASLEVRDGDFGAIAQPLTNVHTKKPQPKADRGRRGKLNADKRERKQAEKSRKAEQAASEPVPTDSRFLVIGKIVGAQGLKGEVKVYPESDFPERFVQPGRRWLLRAEHTAPEPLELLRGRHVDGKGLYVMQFAEVGDRTQAEALKDCTLLVPVGDRPPLEDDEFHILDLIGLAVFDQTTQTLIGTVVSIISAGNDLLEVERVDSESKTTLLIPFVKPIVPIVDLRQRRIEITPPPGLIE